MTSLMKNYFLIFTFAGAAFEQLHAQTLTDSNLPIIIINTDGAAGIPDEPKVGATMKIINSSDGSRNYVSDQNDASKLNYNGRIGIEVRGSTTQFLEKKQYGFETRMADNVTNNNVSLLGMPQENDWILNGLGFDPSLLRDYISYNLSRTIGEYTTRTRYCEVIINGDYRGLYILQEKIKADKNRVDIVKLKSTDNEMPDLSGGYITKCDKEAGQDQAAWRVTSYLQYTNDVAFIHSEPKPSEITPQQANYIHSVFDQLGATAPSSNSITDGFPSIIDLHSFIDFILINELSANVDGYQFSTYFHKDRKGKLRAGPLWDFNLTYGNDLFMWGYNRSKTYTWQFDNGDNIGARFWKDLFHNQVFNCYLAKRWFELTQDGQPLSLSRISTLIDTTASKISEAVAREQQRWATVGDEDSNISDIKNFLTARYDWMNSNIGSASNCIVSTPPLVISKISYNPQTSVSFPESDDQEFIEIINNGNSEVDLSGIYFQGTGLVYQFPSGYKIPAHGTIQLASKFDTFFRLFGQTPFDEYTRHLANEGQKIILSDAYGNIIDEVDYSATAPWPEANGNGKYLSLIDLNLDNNVATNWVAADDALEVSVLTAVDEKSLFEIFPNPTDGTVNVNSDDTIEAVRITDVQGRTVREISSSSNSVSLDLRELSTGIYVLTIQSGSGIRHAKVLKK